MINAIAAKKGNTKAKDNYNKLRKEQQNKENEERKKYNRKKEEINEEERKNKKAIKEEERINRKALKEDQRAEAKIDRQAAQASNLRTREQVFAAGLAKTALNNKERRNLRNRQNKRKEAAENRQNARNEAENTRRNQEERNRNNIKTKLSQLAKNRSIQYSALLAPFNSLHPSVSYISNLNDILTMKNNTLIEKGLTQLFNKLNVKSKALKEGSAAMTKLSANRQALLNAIPKLNEGAKLRTAIMNKKRLFLTGNILNKEPVILEQLNIGNANTVTLYRVKTTEQGKEKYIIEKVHSRWYIH